MVLNRHDKSNRRSYLAPARAGLIGLILLAALTEVSVAQSKSDPQREAKQTEARHQPSEAQVGSAISGTQYHPVCDSPPSREDAEYCQEWRAAVAAQKQAELAFYQLIASIIGIGAVTATLYLTFMATRAAIESVEASQRSAKAAENAVQKSEAILAHAEQTAERQLRAYVYVSEIHCAIINGIRTVKTTFKNFGQTPAYECSIVVKVWIRPYPFDPQGDWNVYKEPPVQSVDTVPPSTISENYIEVPVITPETEQAIASGAAGIWIFGEISYVDCFKNQRCTNIRLVCHGDNWKKGSFSPDKEGNNSN